MKKALNIIVINLIVICAIHSQSCCHTIFLSGGEEIGDDLIAALANSDKVCFRVNPTKNFITVTLNKRVDIVDNEVNFGPRVQIDLIDDGAFSMSGTSTLVGENMGGTRIFKSTPGPSVSMESCSNCIVEDIQLTGKHSKANKDDPPTSGASALNIDSTSSDCEVNNVQVTDFDIGIVVEGNSNVIRNLHFSKVAIDSLDCLPTHDDNYAVLLLNCDDNNVDGIMHRLSPGAISVKFVGPCNRNLVSITTEQEKSPCGTNPSDPALYIPDSASMSNNILTVVLNGGTVHIDGSTTSIMTFCEKNTINNNWSGGFDYSCDGADPEILNSCSID